MFWVIPEKKFMALATVGSIITVLTIKTVKIIKTLLFDKINLIS